jgi:hypothetical protein
MGEIAIARGRVDEADDEGVRIALLELLRARAASVAHVFDPADLARQAGQQLAELGEVGLGDARAQGEQDDVIDHLS